MNKITTKMKKLLFWSKTPDLRVSDEDFFFSIESKFVWMRLRSGPGHQFFPSCRTSFIYCLIVLSIECYSIAGFMSDERQNLIRIRLVISSNLNSTSYSQTHTNGKSAKQLYNILHKKSEAELSFFVCLSSLSVCFKMSVCISLIHYSWMKNGMFVLDVRPGQLRICMEVIDLIKLNSNIDVFLKHFSNSPG